MNEISECIREIQSVVNSSKKITNRGHHLRLMQFFIFLRRSLVFFYAIKDDKF